MEEVLTQLASNAPYLVIIGIILLSGLGLPLPEDIPLILAGYLCGQGYANPWVMFPACFVAIVGADAMLYVLGRRYGHHVPRMPLLRRFLTPANLARTERLLYQHGGKFIFAARFLPGLRAPAMFTAGVFKVPAWKFLLYDGGAAALSVPLILGLAYRYSDQLRQVKEWVQDGQLAAIALVIAGIAVFVAIKLLMRYRLAAARGGT